MAILTGVLVWAKSQAIGLGIGTLIPLGFMFAKKYIPNIIGKFVGSKIDDSFKHIDDIKDEKKKELIKNIAIDIVKLVEYEIPDKGMGKEKYKKAAEKLINILPFLKGKEEMICELIESSVLVVNEKFKEKANEGEK